MVYLLPSRRHGPIHSRSCQEHTRTPEAGYGQNKSIEPDNHVSPHQVGEPASAWHYKTYVDHTKGEDANRTTVTALKATHSTLDMRSMKAVSTTNPTGTLTKFKEHSAILLPLTRGKFMKKGYMDSGRSLAFLVLGLSRDLNSSVLARRLLFKVFGPSGPLVGRSTLLFNPLAMVNAQVPNWMRYWCLSHITPWSPNPTTTWSETYGNPGKWVIRWGYNLEWSQGV